MKKVLILFMSVFMFIQLAGAEDIDYLLNELARKDDLSFHTKKETAGIIKIFTREDLDRMKIQSLNEIIDHIPFLRNKLDKSGLNDPYYKPYQVNNPSRIRLFINDREIVTPIFGSGLKLFGQADINYIDHIEVYHGIPSYTISIEPSVVIIKAYTKVGNRENTTTIGASIGPHGSYSTYGYKSEKLENYSYFAYINRKDLNRDKVNYQGSELSRDKTSNHMYAQFSNETSDFQLQVMAGHMDRFAGDSWDMTPKSVDTKYTALTSSYTYESLDKSLKTVLGYLYNDSSTDDLSNAPLGVRKIRIFPFLVPYYKSHFAIKEHMIDLKVTKIYDFDDTSLLVGFSNRYKKFDITKYILDGVDYSSDFNHNQEDIVSIFTEVNHELNNENRLILSLNAQKYFENAGIDDDNLYSTRLAHIYSKENFVQKSFLLYGKFHPSSFVLLMNEGASNKIKSEIVYGIVTQSLWKHDNTEHTLLFSRNIYEDGIFRDATGFHNLSGKYTFDVTSFETTYYFDGNDKIDFNFWALFGKYKDSKIDHFEEYGGYISLYKKLYGIDTYNSLSYVSGNSGMSDGWNYNVTLTYPYSKNLSLYIKGINIFDTALKSDYIGINPLTKLNNVSNIDSSVWVGLEYEF